MSHPRFHRTIFVDRRECIAAMAHCLVRLSPYDYPDTLTDCLADFVRELDATIQWSSLEEMQYVDGFDLNTSTVFFSELIDRCPSIVALNRPKNGHTKHIMTSRYSGAPFPDDDFIGLDALAQNMTCYFADREDAEAWLERQRSA